MHREMNLKRFNNTAALAYLLWLFVLAGTLPAQTADSLIGIGGSIAPGDSGYISIYLRNTQFSVSGFSMRLELEDTTYASITSIVRGGSVENFDYFNGRLTASACKILGVANMPGGGEPPPLRIGYHELARIYINVSADCPRGFEDSIYFRSDTLPPERDNSISDSTGYINLIPELIGARLVFDYQSGAGQGDLQLPQTPEMAQNYPNPFNAQTNLTFNLPHEYPNISLTIYDIMGRRVKSFYWNTLSAGTHAVIWDGASDSGQNVTSGTYLYRMTSPDFKTEVFGMTLLK